MNSVASCSPERPESSYYRIGSLICEFDASERDEVLLLLIQCIARLPEMPKKVLAMYFQEEFQLHEIAIALGLTEYETDQIRAEALEALQTMLVGQLGLQQDSRNLESNLPAAGLASCLCQETRS